MSIDLLHGRNIDALVQLWSVMVRMLLYPYDGGSFMMRSTTIFLNGVAMLFVVIGYIGGLALVVFTLLA